jgi:ADP-ribose pyrophosphatase YjhB (NUDIX family)
MCVSIYFPSAKVKHVSSVSDAHGRGLLHRGVWAYVFTTDEEIVLQRRTSHDAECPNRWMVLTGHPGPREKPATAAARVIHQELNVPVDYLNFEVIDEPTRKLFVFDKRSDIEIAHAINSHNFDPTGTGHLHVDNEILWQLLYTHLQDPLHGLEKESPQKHIAGAEFVPLAKVWQMLQTSREFCTTEHAKTVYRSLVHLCRGTLSEFRACAHVQITPGAEEP